MSLQARNRQWALWENNASQRVLYQIQNQVCNKNNNNRHFYINNRNNNYSSIQFHKRQKLLLGNGESAAGNMKISRLFCSLPQMVTDKIEKAFTRSSVLSYLTVLINYN